MISSFNHTAIENEDADSSVSISSICNNKTFFPSEIHLLNNLLRKDILGTTPHIGGGRTSTTERFYNLYCPMQD